MIGLRSDKNCSGQRDNALKVHFFNCVHAKGMPMICAWIRGEILNIYSDKRIIWRSSVPVLFQYFTSQNAAEPIRDSKIWPYLADPLLRNEAKLSTTYPPVINNIHNRRFTNPTHNCVFMENLFAKIWTFLCEEKRVKIVSGEEKSHRRVILIAIISAI